MSFGTPAGTRGARQPSGRIAAWMNKLMAKRLGRKGDGKFMGMDALVLTTLGRKTGVERSTPVAWFPGGNDTYLIVASAAGAAGNPAWYHNIAANPDKVRIDVAGRTLEVTAEQLHGTEREQAWRQVVATMPRFTGYQEKTDREIPVIRLTPRPS
ncbi:nitroreductase/quinone reductase family protein [Nocardia lijiangensis]|uniref:nitroreductase/quinone reductase family protein n=1 Tax=Nocardia lijiangensis TaxID=299618 RepID=UPI000B178369|nr:nitroreductase/quinone reductase family protein [Nocardia lijiangensis]